jgi:AraC-like DNA-binding protein
MRVGPTGPKATEAMHADYGKSWSLEALAKASGMSRASFALNFKKLVHVVSQIKRAGIVPRVRGME